MSEALVDHADDKELIAAVAREIRRVEHESPRWRATEDMAAVAIHMTRAHDRDRAHDEEEARA